MDMHIHTLALCGVGQYYSVTFVDCRICPANSVGMYSGISVCPCDLGYYRLDGEDELPCTRKLVYRVTRTR
jgi:hypothetical protein